MVITMLSGNHPVKLIPQPGHQPRWISEHDQGEERHTHQIDDGVPELKGLRQYRMMCSIRRHNVEDHFSDGFRIDEALGIDGADDIKISRG